MTPRKALGMLLVVSTLLRLGWAACLGPGNDEAYHALFVQHPACSYYDHPPMVAVVEAVGLTAARLVGPVVALRLGFILLFAGSTVLMARLAGRHFGAWAGVLAALILNVTAYHSTAASTFALPDGPLVFFWLLTLDRLAVVLERPYRTGPWLAVGLAWGAALLSKYHAILLPAGVLLYLLLEPSARGWLRRPGPYLAAAVGALVFSPVIAWNAAHGWASFAFQGGRAVGFAFRPEYLLLFLGGQALYLLPWMWLFLLGSFWSHRRDLVRPGAHPPTRLLLCLALPPLGMFLAVSCVRPALPHWSLVGFLALMPLLGADWASRSEIDPRRVRRRLALVAVVPVVGVSLFAVQARWGLLQREGRGPLRWVPATRDPSVDLYGWDQVADRLRRIGALDRPGTFVFTNRWYQSGQLAFALGGAAPVLCYNASEAHAFAQWSRPEDWVGHDGILALVNGSADRPEHFAPWFERIEALGTVTVLRAGGPVRTVRLYRCLRQTHPFPFDGRWTRMAARGEAAGSDRVR